MNLTIEQRAKLNSVFKTDCDERVSIAKHGHWTPKSFWEEVLDECLEDYASNECESVKLDPEDEGDAYCIDQGATRVFTNKGQSRWENKQSEINKVFIEIFGEEPSREIKGGVFER